MPRRSTTLIRFDAEDWAEGKTLRVPTISTTQLLFYGTRPPPHPRQRRHSHPLPSNFFYEEGHDSGVDENTQSKNLTLDLDIEVAGRARKENGVSPSPTKTAKGSPKKRAPRSVDHSPIKRTTPTSSGPEKKKTPMNKVEVGKTASPNLKNVRSKIGSLNNTTYKPGGGNVKIETKKLDFSTASSRIQAKNEAYASGGGEKKLKPDSSSTSRPTQKIESHKLTWKAESKIGSLDNKDHRPGGGDKKIETRKINVQAKSKIGSKDNIKHKAGGGDVQIQVQKADFKAKATSKVGSLNNVKHKPGGGERKIFDDKDYLKQMQGGSPSKTPTSHASSGRTSGAQSPAMSSPAPQEEDEVLQVDTSSDVAEAHQ